MVWLISAAWATCSVFSGAQVFTPDGLREGLTVVIDEGEIVGVGKGLRNLKLAMNEQGEVESAVWGGRACAFEVLSGKVLTPGLVEVSSRLGVVEVGLESGTVDDDAGGDPIRAGLQVALAYNPSSSLIPIQRAFGVTSAVVAPSGGLVSGQSAWVDLAGQTQAEAVKADSIALHATLAGSSRAQALLHLAELLEDARDFQRNRAAWDRNGRRAYASGAGRLDLEAMQAVLARRVPLVVKADRASDIEALLRLAKRGGIDLVISGGAEAWLIADQLADADVPVVIDPLRYGPGGFDQIRARPDNGALLAEAGVRVVISTFSTHNARNLRQVAGNAVREGMDHDAALRAITVNPARAFGREDVGAVGVGERANLVVWSGDPLELSSRVEAVYIGGEPQADDHRQKHLLQRYRTMPGQVGPVSVAPDQDSDGG